MEKKWIYYGMFLDEASKEKLLETFADIIPEGWRPYCEHMTVIYNDHSENAQQWAETCEKQLGKTTVLTATELGVSEMAIAVKVYGFPTNNALPHITVAVAPNGKPVQSNEITNWKPLDVQLSLTATLKRYDK